MYLLFGGLILYGVTWGAFLYITRDNRKPIFRNKCHSCGTESPPELEDNKNYFWIAIDAINKDPTHTMINGLGEIDMHFLLCALDAKCPKDMVFLCDDCFFEKYPGVGDEDEDEDLP